MQDKEVETAAYQRYARFLLTQYCRKWTAQLRKLLQHSSLMLDERQVSWLEKQLPNSFDSKAEYFKLMEKAVLEAWTGIVIADKEGNFIFSNRIHEDLTGFSNDMFTKMSAMDMANDYLEDKLSATDLVIEKKKEIVMEQHLVPQDKRILVRGVPVFDENNEVKYVISNVLDVTKTKKLRDELEQVKTEKDALWMETLKLKSGKNKMDGDGLLFKSKYMESLMETLKMVKDSNATVLLLGESGTGKELIAKYLYKNSRRRDKPFIKINCTAIPEMLLESELFGYEPGSFTGGDPKGKIGLLEHADQGTVLLDEIGDMPLNLQGKILRVLQEKEIIRVGGHKPKKVNIRFIASTNANLQKLIAEKKFREDLYYRLNVIPIKVPPLNERREDIPLLVSYFIKKFNDKYLMNKRASYNLLEHMQKCEFKGNVRQLENMIERLVLLSQNDEINQSDFISLDFKDERIELAPYCNALEDKSLNELIQEYEKDILTHYSQKYSSTYMIAKKLKMNQSTIFRKMKRYDIL